MAKGRGVVRGEAPSTRAKTHVERSTSRDFLGRVSAGGLAPQRDHLISMVHGYTGWDVQSMCTIFELSGYRCWSARVVRCVRDEARRPTARPRKPSSVIDAGHHDDSSLFSTRQHVDNTARGRSWSSRWNLERSGSRAHPQEILRRLLARHPPMIDWLFIAIVGQVRVP